MTITDTDDRMALLAEEARYYQPRLFALYGLSKSVEGREILGWGMDFPGERHALFYRAGGETYHAKSPEDVRKLFGVFADVRLSWLDDE